MSDLIALAAAIGLLIGNAFFVGAEFALVSARPEQLAPLAAPGGRRARKTLQASRELSLMMSGAQFGITVCSLGLGAVGEPAVAHLLEGPLEAAGLPEALLHPLAFTVALILVVSLHMVLGEMVPKNIALAGPVRSALLLGPPLLAIVTALRPLMAFLNGLSNLVLRRLLKVETQDEAGSTFTADQVADLIDESHREGLVDDDERELLRGTVGLRARTAADVLLPLESLVTISGNETIGQLEDLTAGTGYSRFPVVADGGPRGYVHVKDLITAGADPDSQVPPGSVRPLGRVAAGQPLADVLTQMQARGAHLAAVADADQRMLGVVALEDVLEELVGQVTDATHHWRTHRPGSG